MPGQNYEFLLSFNVQIQKYEYIIGVSTQHHYRSPLPDNLPGNVFKSVLKIKLAVAPNRWNDPSKM